MKKILIVEGNLKEENQQFTNVGIQTHTESLKESIAYFTKNLEIDVANPSSDPKVFEKIKVNLKKNNISYLDEPYTTFKDKEEEQETFFIKDPHGNILELKTLKN